MTESKTQGVSITETPEFKAAVAEATAASVEQILSKLQAGTNAPVQQSGPDRAFAEGLALAIASLSDPGKKRIPPEVLRSREVARSEMRDMLVQFRRERRCPTYTLRHKVYLDEQLIEPLYMDTNKIQRSTEIDWPGVPNEAMVPVNDEAKQIHKLFLDSIGQIVKVVEEDDFHMTPGGVVVRGAPRPNRHNTRAPMSSAEPIGEGVRVTHRDMPGRYENINVLGTIASPAQQTI